MRVLPPYSGPHGAEWYRGTADALYQNIDFLDMHQPDDVLIVSGDHVYNTSYEPLLRFQMKGIGYTHPEWGHGVWKGELAIGGESWKLDELDPLAFDNQHIQQVMRARMGDEEGIGVLEQIAFGPHARYGFTSILDGAE